MSNKDRLRQETEEVAVGLRRLRDEGEPGSAGTPEVGSLVVSTTTAAWEVQWAVLDRRETEGKLQVAPADAGPLVGRFDLEAAETITDSTVVIRCRKALWVDLQTLREWQKVGSLDADTVARARALARGTGGVPVESFVAAEVDESGRYQEWERAVLAPACEALRRADGTTVLPFANRKTHAGRLDRPPAVRTWRWAASLLLAAVLGFSGGLWWQGRDAQPSGDASRVRANLPIIALTPYEQTRSGGAEERAVELPPNAETVALWLAVDQHPVYPSYGLELSATGDDRPLAVIERLRRMEIGGTPHLSVELDAGLVSTGGYRLVAYGLERGKKRKLHEYRLEIGERAHP